MIKDMTIIVLCQDSFITHLGNRSPAVLHYDRKDNEDRQRHMQPRLPDRNACHSVKRSDHFTGGERFLYDRGGLGNTEGDSPLHVGRGLGGVLIQSGAELSRTVLLAQKFHVTAAVACSDMAIETNEEGESYATIGGVVVKEGPLSASMVRQGWFSQVSA
jgi:hypothetical protein